MNFRRKSTSLHANILNLVFTFLWIMFLLAQTFSVDLFRSLRKWWEIEKQIFTFRNDRAKKIKRNFNICQAGNGITGERALWSLSLHIVYSFFCVKYCLIAGYCVHDQWSHIDRCSSLICRTSRWCVNKYDTNWNLRVTSMLYANEPRGSTPRVFVRWGVLPIFRLHWHDIWLLIMLCRTARPDAKPCKISW